MEAFSQTLSQNTRQRDDFHWPYHRLVSTFNSIRVYGVNVKISGISNRWSYLEPSRNIVLSSRSVHFIPQEHLSFIKLVSLSRPNLNYIVYLLFSLFCITYHVRCMLLIRNCGSLHYKPWLLWDSFCNFWVCICEFYFVVVVIVVAINNLLTYFNHYKPCVNALHNIATVN